MDVAHETTIDIAYETLRYVEEDYDLSLEEASYTAHALRDIIDLIESEPDIPPMVTIDNYILRMKSYYLLGGKACFMIAMETGINLESRLMGYI